MQHRYFAASNSAEGFKNYYPQVFDRVDRLFVIKGGPGTGKSSLMKKYASLAEGRGDVVEYYYCSSDPSSLDGVLIIGKDECFGIVDGTSPHTVEPTVPGARENIIDLGQFWDQSLLFKQKNEIMALSSKKSSAYRRAYSYLRSCGNLSAVTDSLLRKALDRTKLCQAVGRELRSLSLPQGECRILPALQGAVGMTGRVRFDSFERNAKTCVKVGELYGVGRMYLDRLAEALRKCDVTVRISYDPIDPLHIDGLFIEERETAYVIESAKSPYRDSEAEGEEGGRHINTKRFVDSGILKEVRGELRYAQRLYDDCENGALHALREAGVYHFLLEDIYKNAMDFKRMNNSPLGNDK